MFCFRPLNNRLWLFGNPGQPYFPRIFDLTAFSGKNDKLYHTEQKGPENGLKTAVPGKKESGARFTTFPGFLG